jgi:hypothetical protein
MPYYNCNMRMRQYRIAGTVHYVAITRALALTFGVRVYAKGNAKLHTVHAYAAARALALTLASKLAYCATISLPPAQTWHGRVP